MEFFIRNDMLFGTLYVKFKEGEILIREPDIRDRLVGKFKNVETYMPGERIYTGKSFWAKLLSYIEGFRIGILHATYGEDSQLLKEEAEEDDAELVLRMHYPGEIVMVDLNSIPTRKILVRPGGFFAAAANAVDFDLFTPENAALNSLFAGAYGTKDGVSFQTFELPGDGSIIDENTGKVFIEAVGNIEEYDIDSGSEMRCDPSKLLAMTANIKVAPLGDAEYNAGIVDQGWYRLTVSVDEEAVESTGHVWLDSGLKLVK